MQVQVERRPGHLGGEMPVPFRLGGREIEIVENVDQWYGPDYWRRGSPHNHQIN